MNNFSFWESPTFSFDVVIIGGGFLGSWTAYELSKNTNLSIAIIERSSLSNGASTKNAGFACFGSPTELRADIQLLGKVKALEITRQRILGIKKIQSILGDESILFDDCGGYELFLDENTIPTFDEIEYLNSLLQSECGFAPFSFLSTAQIRSLGFSENVKGGIANPFEGSLHPVKALETLHRAVKAKGVHIFHNTEFSSYSIENETISIISNGYQASCNAKRVIHCTNAFSQHSDIMPGRGQVFITNVIDSLPLRGTFHYDEGYVYFRNVVTKEGNRILIGGGRNKDFTTEQTTNFGPNPKILSFLEQFLATILPKETSFFIENAWNGIMGFSRNKLPIVSQLNSNEFFGFACNGMGVALTPIIAEELALIVHDSL